MISISLIYLLQIKRQKEKERKWYHEWEQCVTLCQISIAQPIALSHVNCKSRERAVGGNPKCAHKFKWGSKSDYTHDCRVSNQAFQFIFWLCPISMLQSYVKGKTFLISILDSAIFLFSAFFSRWICFNMNYTVTVHSGSKWKKKKKKSLWRSSRTSLSKWKKQCSYYHFHFGRREKGKLTEFWDILGFHW